MCRVRNDAATHRQSESGPAFSTSEFSCCLIRCPISSCPSVSWFPLACLHMESAGIIISFWSHRHSREARRYLPVSRNVDVNPTQCSITIHSRTRYSAGNMAQARARCSDFTRIFPGCGQWTHPGDHKTSTHSHAVAYTGWA